MYGLLYLIAGMLGVTVLAAQPLTQPPFTPANERISGLAQRQKLAQQSIVNSLAFKSIGPTAMSGRVADLDVWAEDPSHFYVAYASGGLWYTHNNGASFEPLFDREAVMGMGAGLRVGGSGTLGLVEAANGRLEGYIEQHINSWDACAAVAIAREAGAWVNEFDTGDWLASGNPVGIGAPALGAILAPLLKA